LPTGGISNGAEERDPIRLLALDQDLRGCLTLLHQVLGREQAPPLQRRLDTREHVIIRSGCRRGLHMDHQMGRFGITGFRHMDFLAHPLDLAFRAVAGLRVIG
jgi:hypothetical protein